MRTLLSLSLSIVAAFGLFLATLASGQVPPEDIPLYPPIPPGNQPHSPQLSPVMCYLFSNSESLALSSNTIAVEEKDSGATVTRTMTDSYQFATNITTSITTGTDIKYGYSTGMSNTTTHSSTITETYQQGNDSLGSIVVEFSHPIIQARNDIGNQAKLFVYSTGAVDIIMLPQTI